MSRGLSARQFGIDLARFGATTRKQASTIFRKIVLELDTRIVLGTPVDIGAARGNWYPSVNTPSNAVDPEASDPSGSASLGRLNGMVAGLQVGDVAWFTNNLPYILRLENGWSDQAPGGMVDVNLNAVASFYGGVIER